MSQCIMCKNILRHHPCICLQLSQYIFYFRDIVYSDETYPEDDQVVQNTLNTPTGFGEKFLFLSQKCADFFRTRIKAPEKVFS